MKYFQATRITSKLVFDLSVRNLCKICIFIKLYSMKYFIHSLHFSLIKVFWNLILRTRSVVLLRSRFYMKHIIFLLSFQWFMLMYMRINSFAISLPILFLIYSHTGQKFKHIFSNRIQNICFIENFKFQS